MVDYSEAAYLREKLMPENCSDIKLIMWALRVLLNKDPFVERDEKVKQIIAEELQRRL